MIHEKLHGTNSGSMPELAIKKSSPRKQNERSVDEVPLPKPRVPVQSNVPPPVLYNAPQAQNNGQLSENKDQSAENIVPPQAKRSLPAALASEDPDEEMTVFEFVRGLSVLEAKENASNDQSSEVTKASINFTNEATEKPSSSSSNIVVEPPALAEDFQKRVKFEKVNEIRETFYEVQVDENFGESSTDEPFGYQEASSGKEAIPRSPEVASLSSPEADLPPPTPMKRKSRENSLQHVDDELLPNNQPVFERVSSEYKFVKSEEPDVSNNDPIIVEIPFEETPAQVVDYSGPDGVIGQIPDTELPIAAELNAVLETMPPLVKPRTKTPVQRTSDVGKIEEIDHVQETAQKLPPEKPERAPVVSFAHEDVPVQQKLPEEAPKSEVEALKSEVVETFKTSQNQEPTEEFFVSNKFSENYENFSHQDLRNDDEDSRFASDDSDSSSEARVSPPIENNRIVPKSILKTSEASGVQKTITFHNVPDSVSSSSESFFSDEEQDVWSQVDQQRFHLSRHRSPETPPPLPKTPPPTAEEESRFSYA